MWPIAHSTCVASLCLRSSGRRGAVRLGVYILRMVLAEESIAPKLWLGAVVALLLLGITLLTGCGQSTSADPTYSNLATIAIFYAQYRGQNRGGYPKDEQTLKEFIKATGKGVTDVDELFVSERDKQPYVLMFGKNIIRDADGVEYVGYESEGMQGKRLVAQAGGFVVEMTEDEFQAKFPGR